MNTLQYFLSTLRPAPPPSPRASTSELPLPSLSLHHHARVSSADLVDLALAGAELPSTDDTAVAGGEAGEGREAGGKGMTEGTAKGQRGQAASEGLGRAPSRRGSTRKGKGRERDRPVIEVDGAAVEDPVRDGETVRTELERGEGVEGKFVDGLGVHGGGPEEQRQLPTQPPSPMPSPLPELSLPPPSSSTSLNTTLEKPFTPPAPSPTSTPYFPLLTRLTSLLPSFVTVPLRLISLPLRGVYLLLHRFLALFGLVEKGGRPGWNALLVPSSSSSSSPSASASPSQQEKGEDPSPPSPSQAVTRRGSRVLTVSLSFSSSSSRSPSPSRSSTPSTSSSSQSLSVPRPLPPPPPPPRLTPKTLVLDLDETLIHSTSRPYSKSRSGGGKGGQGSLKTRVVEVVLEGRSTVYTVYKRPWVDFFLRKVSTWYTIVIFTASLPEYADPVIDWLDGGDGRGGMIASRLFRKDCVARNGSYMKDLTVVDEDLRGVCLVDNSPASYAINQANGIPIEGWINDPTDECLLDLLPMLDSLRFTNDVRRVLGLRGFGKTGTGGGGGMVGGGGRVTRGAVARAG
ncbi:hypothetical protein JCM8547_005073 [Rhodosporidiobolus lusitaniae]